MAQTTTPTSNTMSTPDPGVGTSTPTLSIILWSTRYLERAVATPARDRGCP